MEIYKFHINFLQYSQNIYKSLVSFFELFFPVQDIFQNNTHVLAYKLSQKNSLAENNRLIAFELNVFDYLTITNFIAFKVGVWLAQTRFIFQTISLHSHQ